MGCDSELSRQEVVESYVAPTVDQSTDLDEVLEFGSLPNACERYKNQPENHNAKLHCGKYQFFYEGFNTPGVPAPLMQTYIKNLPEHIGDGFEKLGMFTDPNSEQNLPIGFGPTVPSGTVETKAFTCASCHFGKTKQGVYTVGLPNHELEYGKLTLYLFALTNVVTGFQQVNDYAPSVAAELQPLVDYLDANPARKAALIDDVLTMGQELISSGGNASLGDIPVETPSLWVRWAPGVMDFFTSPFPEDNIHIPIRIPSLWEIPREEEIRALGLRHAMLTAAGGGDSLLSFVKGFISTSKGVLGDFSDEDLEPIVEYIYSLKHPEYQALVANLDDASVTRGQQQFTNQGCIDCHNGKSFGGTDVFEFGQESAGSRLLGTDSTLRFFSDPELDGTLCCDLPQLGNSELTQGLKAPHLTGIWSHRIFLHNGSVGSLEELLCLNGQRPLPIVAEGESNQGHEFGCGMLRSDKLDLLNYLRSL